MYDNVTWVIKLTDSPYCTIPEHGMHVNYLPFFFDNDAIRSTKKNMVGLPQLKQELDQVTEANVLQGSAFVTGPISTYQNFCQMYCTNLFNSCSIH